MTREEIDEVVCDIMIHDGADRHVDGHDVITDFIMAILANDFYSWKQEYYIKNNIEY